jgi:hypothetical protein
VWLYLALLLPSLAGEVAQYPAADGQSERTSSRKGHSTPYLLAIGPPELRFEEAPPSPAWADPATAALPPKTATAEPTAKHSDVVISNQTSAAASAVSAPLATGKTDPNLAAPPGPPPATILPDDVTPKVRPEDFLPYFQFPGAGQNEPNTAPTPRPIPSSSATYQEQ